MRENTDLNNIEPFNYQFPAIRGIQADREYYVAMCPLKIIPKLFIFDEEELPPEMRAQRILNRSRVPEIKNYLIENSHNYVFSSITVSIDGIVQFLPFGSNNLENKIGTLVVPMTAQFIINDGQHRRAAIEEALKEKPEMGNETISVVFFLDKGLKMTQQMFADLNQHAVRPTKSLGILYNNRDPYSKLAVKLANNVPIFKGLTELEKTNISNRSVKLFTLSSIYQATIALLGKKKADRDVSKEEEELAMLYWDEVSKNIPEWRIIRDGQKLNSHELRNNFIHSHGIALHSLGVMGHSLIKEHPNSWRDHLNKLNNVDWLRSNATTWEGRAMVGGRINKSQMNLMLTTNVLKNALGLKLSPEEDKAENNCLTK